jgi:hypothetical protein
MKPKVPGTVKGEKICIVLRLKEYIKTPLKMTVTEYW